MVIDNRNEFIRLDNLWKQFQEGNQKREVLQGAFAKFKRGEFIAILGKSGSGKSTLLNVISGIDQPDRYSLLSALGPGTGRAFQYDDWHRLRSGVPAKCRIGLLQGQYRNRRPQAAAGLAVGAEMAVLDRAALLHQ